MPKKPVRGKARARLPTAKSVRKPAARRAKPKLKKAAARTAKPANHVRPGASAKKRKDYEATSIYEEVTITCPGCGKVSRVIKLAGISTEGLICQRCAKGEMEIEDMDF